MPDAVTRPPSGPEAARELAGHYRLLAELFAREPDAELLELAAEVPALHTVATRKAAAEHTNVFVLNVYPFASVFLDPDGSIDGPRTGFTRGVLAALGLSVAPGQAPDHAAVLFDALADLLEREADATAVKGAAAASVQVRRARHAQRVVLFEHLLPWVPMLLAAIERVDAALYGAAAAHARAILTEHAQELLADGPVPVTATEAASAGGEDTETDSVAPASRADALAWLTTPARCGLYLSRADLTGLAADLDLALRFGGRAFMLDSLVQSAAQRDRTAQLTDALRAAIVAQRTALAWWETALPELTALWQPWLERSEATLEVLGRGSDGAWPLGATHGDTAETAPPAPGRP